MGLVTPPTLPLLSSILPPPRADDLWRVGAVFWVALGTGEPPDAVEGAMFEGVLVNEGIN